MKKKTLNNLLLTAVFIICFGIISGCGSDSGSSSTANNAPAADDMSVITDMDAQVQITLTADDPDGDALAWHIDSNPVHGSLSGAAPDLSFTPDSGYFGIDTFTFYVDDGTKYSNTATVTIQIKSKNILFVDINASGNGDGSSWEDAFNHPQDAIDAASSGEQVWISAGTYLSKNAADPATPVIQLKEEIYIYGGFDGTESNFSERDFENNITILDGNNEVYHVVIGASYTTIDGFTVTRGNANGDDHPDYSGAGMYNGYHLYVLSISNCKFTNNRCNRDGAGIYNYYCSPSINCCSFENNTAAISSTKTNNGGAGIYNNYCSPKITECSFTNNQSMEGNGGGNGGAAIYNNDSSPTIQDCTFNGNSTYDDSGSGGGAIYNWRDHGVSSYTKVISCTFQNNSSYSGGAIYNYDSKAKITHCSFTGNDASANGGAICNSQNSTNDSPEIKNCCIYGNTAQDGGGIYNYFTSSEIINCTVTGNSASYGGGIFNGNAGSDPVIITNCIIWGNTANPGDPQITNSFSSPTISCCNIDADGYAGSNGNIRSDPFFINGPSGNYYLSHIAAGQAVNSPCIDTGSDTAENLDLTDRTTRTDSGPDTGVADMGYHYEQ